MKFCLKLGGYDSGDYVWTTLYCAPPLGHRGDESDLNALFGEVASEDPDIRHDTDKILMQVRCLVAQTDLAA
jgi:hypothetical protein